MYELTVGGVHYPILELNIKKTLKEINSAKVTTIALFSTETSCTIDYTVGGYTPIFCGIIKRSKETDPTVYELEIMENAVELIDQYVDSSGDFKTYITSATSVDYILDSVILAGSNPTWSRSPTYSDASTVGACSFYYMKRLNGLFKVLGEQKGHNVWFDGVNRKVEFGQYRVDSPVNITDYILVKPEKDALKRNINRILVIGGTDAIKGDAGTGNKILVYQYKDVTKSAEAQSIAEQLLVERDSEKSRQEVTLSPGAYITTVAEGSRVILNAATYTVYDMTIKLDGTVIGLEADKETLLDLLEDTITEFAGEMAAGVRLTWDGGWQNVGGGEVT